MKKLILIVIAIIIIGVGAYALLNQSPNPDTGDSVVTPPPSPSTTDAEDEEMTVLGQSVEDRDIMAYHYGTGDEEILFIGGVHGGYSWNTTLVAYELMDYLEATPSVIPANVRVTVIPMLNPDGLFKVVGTTDRFDALDVPSLQSLQESGRFNAHTVDLNRNFDCDWKPIGKWQTRDVSGGDAPFSEPESRAFKNYIDSRDPAVVLAWFSAAGGVFSSRCDNGILSETRTLTNLYADASGYKAYASFDFYETSGDMLNWLAKENIPSISVLLTNHTDTEWTKNKAGIDALLAHFAQ